MTTFTDITQSTRPQRKKSARCNQCMMILPGCICALLPHIDTRTRLCLIIQTREARKPTNTGLLAARCLSNSEVHVRGDARQPLDYAAMIDPDYEPVFLFPGPEAIPLTPEALSGLSKPVKLFVADGNWGQAIRIHRRFQAAVPVRSVFLPPGEPTRYRIRKEHGRPEGLATMEAIARTLGVLEGPEVEAQLTGIFLTMVETTLQARGKGATHKCPPG